ncbi:hypothetical protein PIB30_054522 [Stylosanthes scabra]|uniref:Uncharacterized protein n=1 Tax=Stylosanthes scabra TaxID=79078 RepID=A0ABU6WIM9_9FABA|nr:hypothetical protein [Stylosanthes scabra]
MEVSPSMAIRNASNATTFNGGCHQCHGRRLNLCLMEISLMENSDGGQSQNPGIEVRKRAKRRGAASPGVRRPSSPSCRPAFPSTGAAVSADVSSLMVEQVPKTGSTVDWCRSLEFFPEIVRKMDKKPLKLCLKATAIQELPDSSVDLVGL